MLRSSYNNENAEQRGSNMAMLFLCKEYWDGLNYVRRVRRRNRDFRDGFQWTAQELETIEKKGNKPITQNYISTMVRNLIGQYSGAKGRPAVIARKQDSVNESRLMTKSLEHVVDINNDDWNDTKMLQDMMCGGIACCRVGYDWISERDTTDVVTLNVNINELFFNTDIKDDNLNTLNIIGLIHQGTIDDLIAKFADASSMDDQKFIREIYNYNYSSEDVKREYFQRRMTSYINQDSKELDNLDFFVNSTDKCRYYEIWRKERRRIIKYHDTENGTYGVSEISTQQIDKINRMREAKALKETGFVDNARLIKYNVAFEFVWKVTYMTPNGFILKEEDSPYAHQSHPFVLSFYNILDGQIHPILNDVIPLQQSVNRIAMQMDFIMHRQSKGMAFVAEQILPDRDKDGRQLAKAISSQDALYIYKHKDGVPMPQQIYANSNAVLSELASIKADHIAMMQQILGVNSAIQGMKADYGTPTSRYQLESSNAQLNSKEMFDLFTRYKEQKYAKVVKLIKQFYSPMKYQLVAGSEIDIEYKDDVNQLDYDCTITMEDVKGNIALTESDQVYNMAMQQLIPIKMALQVSTARYARPLLDLITKEEKEQAEQQQQMMAMQQQQMPQEAMNVPQGENVQPNGEMPSEATETAQTGGNLPNGIPFNAEQIEFLKGIVNIAVEQAKEEIGAEMGEEAEPMAEEPTEEETNQQGVSPVNYTAENEQRINADEEDDAISEQILAEN